MVSTVVSKHFEYSISERENITTANCINAKYIHFKYYATINSSRKRRTNKNY